MNVVLFNVIPIILMSILIRIIMRASAPKVEIKEEGRTIYVTMVDGMFVYDYGYVVKDDGHVLEYISHNSNRRNVVAKNVKGTRYRTVPPHKNI